jgi:hypothetical protein
MTVVYLYGFVPPETALPGDGLLGVDDTRVELVPYPGFAAAVSRLPEDGYGDAALERKGKDMEWMAAQGLGHEQVVAWFVDHSAILPSRLLTLFSGQAALDDVARAGAERIREALDRFSGLREWNLKVGFDAARIEPHLGEISETIAELDREIEAAAPGRAFLLKKKRGDMARTESRGAAIRTAQHLLDRLAPMAESVARLDLPADRAPVVLNAALLLPREREAEALDVATAEIDRLARIGVEVRYTGPWAPYRFVGGLHG